MSDSTRFWRDAAMPFVESRRACESRVCYRAHSHPSFSIGAVDAGSSVFTGAGDTPVVLQPGSVVFIPAGCLHACNPLPDQCWSYQMLHLDADWLQALWRESGRLTLAIDEEAEEGAGAGRMARVFSDPAVYRDFYRMNDCLFSVAPVWEKEAALVDFLLGLELHQGAVLAPAPSMPADEAPLRRVMHFLKQHPERRSTLSELAALAGMGRHQLIRQFRAWTGLPPHAWQLDQCINLARDRLREGADLAELAQELGFADQAHFQRAFKARAGVPPGRYRA